MAGFNSPTFFLICAAVFVVFSCSSTAVQAGLGIHHSLAWIPNQSTCKGSIAECFGGEEFEFDSEINRRILATSQYISYGALRRNTVPCSRRGASYYNCQPGAQANPYSRGCSAITRCRSWIICLYSLFNNLFLSLSMFIDLFFSFFFPHFFIFSLRWLWLLYKLKRGDWLYSVVVVVVVSGENCCVLINYISLLNNVVVL